MRHLAERIKSCIENGDGDPWFPSLTSDLVDHAARAMERERELTLPNYGTARFLARNARGPRNIVKTVRPQTGDLGCVGIPIEVLPQAVASGYEQKGARFYSEDEITAIPGILRCVQEALDVLSRVATVLPTVTTLVRALHLLKVEDDEFDVSFSEPALPFSAFVSVPGKRIPNDALRVAEAILHEAMHLQLTLLECVTPMVMVSSEECRYPSPWRRELRSASGILQGCYVFHVIRKFSSTVVSKEDTERGEVYFRSRINEIEQQLSEARESVSGSGDLSTIGATLFDNSTVVPLVVQL